MPGSFWAQFAALCRKNWIVISRHWIINIVRCIILPVAYAAFFAKAQDFFTTRGVLGEGHISSLQSIPPDLLGHRLVWSPPPAALSNATLNNITDTLMATVLEGVHGDVVKVSNESLVEGECPQNFNLLSGCFVAVTFSQIDLEQRILNYTMRGDFGLAKVDVANTADDDVQERYLPLQWAIDKTFISMATGSTPPSPLTWEYTNESNAQLAEENRLSYLGGIRSLIVLAFFLVFLGVVYQLPGSMASERASLLTSHLEAMGCRKSARVVSWNLSISAAYFPAWLVVAVIFQHFIFTGTNAGLFIILYILTGLSLASWTQLVAVPFANAPTLAAITATFFAIILAIVALIIKSNTVVQLVLTLVFPPMFYTFFTKALCSFEQVPSHPNILHRSPGRDAPVLGLLLIAIIDIFLFPLLATWLESKVYGVRPPDFVGFWARLFGKKRPHHEDVMGERTAVKLEHVRKTYSGKFLGLFGRSKSVVAIEDLSFSVPKGEIFCLLGRNGAAKSTTLHIIARLLSADGGHIRYSPDLHIGIASQKDVLWDELTCKQHVELWRAIKTTKHHRQAESNMDLLARCDLAPKVSFLSKNLSGGQKRKLQLACALAGGSNLLLLDEISSGLDPLSRRAIWKLITANRGSSTIVLTTHFLDEADYLGDQVAILQAPGRLLALDNPVALKTQLGHGFVLAIDATPESDSVRDVLHKSFPDVVEKEVRGKHLFITGSPDVAVARRLVDLVQSHRRETGGEWGYQVNSATLEQVFLDLNTDTPSPESSVPDLSPVIPGGSRPSSTPSGDKDLAPSQSTSEKDLEASAPSALPTLVTPLALTTGKKPSYLLAIPVDSWTIFRKRLLVLRRSWLLPLIGVVVVLCAAIVPLFFMKDRKQTCAFVTTERRLQHLTYPRSAYPLVLSPVVLAPQDAFGNLTLPSIYVTTVPDNSSFINLFSNNYTNLSFGGISLPSTSGDGGQPIFAWEGTSLTNKGPSLLNLLSNALLDRLIPHNATTINDYFRINLDFRYLPSPSFQSTAQAMKWIGFFGLGVAIWPAFAVIYPTQERANNVRANQYSNGATPVALWLGHLLHEFPAILLVSTLVIILFSTLSHQFNAPGDLWICFVLYGIAGTLYSYLFALFLDSPLAAWALVAGINVILFLLYLASYLLILTYDRSSAAATHITICHFTIGLINPVPNILRAVLVSINLFSLLCDGLGNYSTAPYSSILQFGGPILYLVVQALFAFSILVYVDSGSPIPSFLRSRRKHKDAYTVPTTTSPDVIAEKERVAAVKEDELRVIDLHKKFSRAEGWAVDGVSFGVNTKDTFALIGPNGAGKTTTLACIRGVELPTGGDVMVANHSIVKQRNAARSYLGVCPQVNAIDPNLTVRHHLWLYGRLKGVPSRPLRADIKALLSASGLLPKADALATSLSGGNQRKLSLAIALIGDRPVVLIDEFSSGVDPFSKREAWATLATLTKDRAVVMTTHSMEEVDALASRVGIIASKLLAVGTPGSLKSRFATYEVHLSADQVERVLEYLRTHGFEEARPSWDTLTRVSVPGVREEVVGRLMEVLQGAKEELSLEEMTIHEASTETAFLEIVRHHNVQEEVGRVQRPSKWRRWLGRKHV